MVRKILLIALFLVIGTGYSQTLTVSISGASNNYNDTIKVSSPKAYSFISGNTATLTITANPSGVSNARLYLILEMYNGTCPVCYQGELSSPSSGIPVKYVQFSALNSGGCCNGTGIAVQEMANLTESKTYTYDIATFPIDDNIVTQNPIFLYAIIANDTGIYATDMKVILFNPGATGPSYGIFGNSSSYKFYK